VARFRWLCQMAQQLAETHAGRMQLIYELPREIWLLVWLPAINRFSDRMDYKHQAKGLFLLGERPVVSDQPPSET